MITHGYLRLPRDHPRLPRAAIQVSSCGVMYVYRFSERECMGLVGDKDKDIDFVKDKDKDKVFVIDKYMLIMMWREEG